MRYFVEHLIVFRIELSKESVLLRREISLKVFCEKVNFLNCDFAMLFVIMNKHTCKLFNNILNDVQTKGNGEIITS